MSGTLARTQFGLVEGLREGDVCVWRGIPYAAPPINSRRFHPPQNPESWTGVRETKEFGPASLQSKSPSMEFLLDSPVSQAEDCLYLNVWSPCADSHRRPVMVWIHGGSFNYGSGSSCMYDGRFFAEQGVVVVTINYRVGVFGFLYLGEVGDEDYRDSVNCGLLDQVAALKWVNGNIDAFGGDPDNVTIFGESAGAVSVGNLLSMASAKGLFHKAILQSGTARANVTRETANELTRKLLDELQLNTGNLSKLEHLPAETIMNAIGIFPRRVFGPVGDGVVMPERPDLVLAEGVASNIPVIVGTNLDESRLFTNFDPVWKGQTDEQNVKKILESSFQSLWEAVYQSVMQNGELTRKNYEDAMTHYVFTYPAIFFGESQARNGGQVWMYRFDYESTALDGSPRAYHALEIPFVWNTIRNPETERMTGSDANRFIVAEHMHRRWIAFAHHGDPNVPGLPSWPQYDPQYRSTMIFDVNSGVVMDPDCQKRLSWEQVFRHR
ncbi:carboxylesterase/lipase family protein [Alicyclobacillus sp. ALC3]|nr:carboxylesterase/lipase family protein [Alicyclobacillus sp. ALC3]WDL97684.1 carboxylesterase/lipase family protein [Alicyclobacillus sp. ALC3]